MHTTEQKSWISKFLGSGVDTAIAAVKTVAQSLPGSAMLPDCKPVKGKVPGPAQHLLCTTHGHIVDIKEKKIIAINLDQYKSQNMGGAKPPHAAAPAHGAPPAAPAPAAPAPAAATPTAATQAPPPAPTATPQPPPASAASPAAPDPAKALAEMKKLLTLMQLEADDIANVLALHEDLAGGGKLNRAISWISDTAGGADDPGDDLAEISTKITMERVLGLAAATKLDFTTAQQHLDTMKSLNDKAHRLWQKYTGDTIKGAERTVTGLEVVSKAGDVATMGLNVVAPGTGKILSVAKNVSVTGSKLAFNEKVNWTEFTVDMAFDLFVGGKNSQLEKAAQKVAGPLAKKLAPKVVEAIAKKLGGKVAQEAVVEYIEHAAEELIKTRLKAVVTPVAEHVVESAKDKDITHGQVVDMMLNSVTDPSGQFAKQLADKLAADLQP